jgi:hypothetical protein
LVSYLLNTSQRRETQKSRAKIVFSKKRQVGRNWKRRVSWIPTQLFYNFSSNLSAKWTSKTKNIFKPLLNASLIWFENYFYSKSLIPLALIFTDSNSRGFTVSMKKCRRNQFWTRKSREAKEIQKIYLLKVMEYWLIQLHVLTPYSVFSVLL